MAEELRKQCPLIIWGALRRIPFRLGLGDLV